MNRIVTTGVVLKRINFGEADRIITVLTPDHGKLRLMAKGVRKVKSKLAGGIELFSISSITYIPGKRDISTLISSRLVTHFAKIIQDIDRTTATYDVLKLLDKATEDECEEGYYHLAVKTLDELNELSIEPKLATAWFMLNLLDLMGHRPNLITTQDNRPLSENSLFNFDFERMGFFEHPTGTYQTNDIKLLRLMLKNDPGKLSHIKDIHKHVEKLGILLTESIRQFVR